MDVSLYTEQQRGLIGQMQAAARTAPSSPARPVELRDLVRHATAELRQFQAENPKVSGRALRQKKREIALKYYRMGKALRKEHSRGHSAQADVAMNAATPPPADVAAQQPAATLPSADVAQPAATPERDVAKDGL